jgi:uncharacterized membrane protein
MEKTSKIMNKYVKWVIALAIFGVGLAVYLYYEYLVQDTYGICNINAVFNCEPITKGALAELYGIPVALIGLAGYLTIAVTAFLKKFKWSFFMATFGMIFCLRLTILEIFVEGVLCPVCLACQAVMLVEFILTYQLAFPEKTGLTSSQETKTK